MDDIVVVYAVPIIGLIVSIFTFYSGVKQRTKADVAEMTAISVKLDHHTEKLERIETLYTSAVEEQHDHATRITRCETEIKNLKIRLTELDEELKQLERGSKETL